eukprot:jgi/Bigna1/68660/fgenesh1_pg.6_\
MIGNWADDDIEIEKHVPADKEVSKANVVEDEDKSDPPAVGEATEHPSSTGPPPPRTDRGSRKNSYRSRNGSGNGGGGRSNETAELPTGPPYKAFVGNLPHSINHENVVEDIFARCNIVNIRLVENRNTGKFKGFGYVEFETLDDLKEALGCNGMNYRGRIIRVDVAQDKAPRDENRRGYRGDRGNSRRDSGGGGGRRGRRGGRGGGGTHFRYKGPVREESPVKATEKINPFGAARPREEILAERKKKDAEEAKKKKESTHKEQRGYGRRGSGRRGRGRGRGGRRGKSSSDESQNGGQGQGGRGARRGTKNKDGAGGSSAHEGGRRRDRRKSGKKKTEKEAIPYVPEFRKIPLKKPESSKPTTTSNPFELLQYAS